MAATESIEVSRCSMVPIRLLFVASAAILQLIVLSLHENDLEHGQKMYRCQFEGRPFMFNTDLRDL
ncbi:hypothetical protein DERP_002704 [Dermatophagoides pteronyssinus]|uniref:Uncharacterized protein n=1 Tax=Dermatophagoides pteronyssinus TaxID=6956 RepID=A0ABQ8JVG6_DERPT|nr:hypothetical protein DERP_002704 [Dermatophagoides pteronyssinus]